MAGCETCIFLSRSTDHLETDYLKEQVQEDRFVYTCVSGEQFTNTWAFGNISNKTSICAGKYYQQRKNLKRFRFNRNGICRNPRSTVIADSKKYRFVYYICQRRDVWYWSAHYEKKGSGDGCGGGGFFPGPGDLKKDFQYQGTFRKEYTSERLAIKDAAKSLLSDAERFPADTELKKIKESLKKIINPYGEQLVLFKSKSNARSRAKI